MPVGGTKTEPPTEAYNYAAEIKLRATRKLGQLLKDAPMQGPGQHWQKSNGTKTEPLLVPPTLAESGLTLKQSSKALLLRLRRIRPSLIFDELLWLNR